MKRKNCWEILNCGKAAVSGNPDLGGSCPASWPCHPHDGINKGTHSGRHCWTVPGTLCGEGPKGSYAEKLPDCLGCKVFKLVCEEEERSFVLAPQGINWAQDREI